MKKTVYVLTVSDIDNNHYPPTIHNTENDAIKEIKKDLEDHYQMNEEPYIDKDNFNEMIKEMKISIHNQNYWGDEDTEYFIDKVEIN